jgi:hypothetical protein
VSPASGCYRSLCRQAGTHSNSAVLSKLPALYISAERRLAAGSVPYRLPSKPECPTQAPPVIQLVICVLRSCSSDSWPECALRTEDSFRQPSPDSACRNPHSSFKTCTTAAAAASGPSIVTNKWCSTSQRGFRSCGSVLHALLTVKHVKHLTLTGITLHRATLKQELHCTLPLAERRHRVRHCGLGDHVMQSSAVQPFLCGASCLT